MSQHSIFRCRYVLLLLMLGGIPMALAAKPPVLIGLDAEFGHLTSTSDDAIRMGALTAIDEINAAGGVLGGRPLQLAETDNRSIPARGVDNFKELAARQDIVAVLVSKFSPVALEQAPLAEALGLPLLSAWGAADGIVRGQPAGSYTFRLSLRDSLAVPAMLDYLLALGLSRVGVILPNSSWGRSNETQIRSYSAHSNALSIVGKEWYNWGTETLHENYEKVAALGAQAILFVGNEPEGSRLVKMVAALPAELRLPIISHWGVTGGNFVQLTGEDLGKVDFAVVQTFTFNGNVSHKALDVAARAIKLFNLKDTDGIPSQVGFAHAYDLTHIVARAVESAGTTERGAVRSALEQVRDYPGLMRRFAQPFTTTSHEALTGDDVFIGKFTVEGSVSRLP